MGKASLYVFAFGMAAMGASACTSLKVTPAQAAEARNEDAWGSAGPEVRSRRLTLHDGVGIVEIARRFIGTPYRYGGSSPAGFDCSGYVKYVYQKAGYKVPHGARAQFQDLRRVQQPRVGDLVFFRTMGGDRVSHVGIYVGNLKMLHSPRSGKTVEYADMRLNYWRTRYAGARTIFRYANP